MNLHIVIICIFGFAIQCSSSSRVLELTDRFPEIRKDGGLWLVKFYAPWCGHCKRLEPIWMHVAQALAKTNIKVGKVDVTRFPNVASEFKAYATPTIKFIKPEEEHTFNGERTKEAIVHYALRMVGPPVQEVRQAGTISKWKKEGHLYFMYVGEREGSLWSVYFNIASILQPHVFFYSIDKELGKSELPSAREPYVFVHKDGEHFHYEDVADLTILSDEPEYLNTSLYKWINEERFGFFPRISNENLREVMQTGKYIVLAIVEENKISHIPEDMLHFRNKIESVIRKKRDLYHKHFQFGWMGNAELANSVTMERVALPYLLVINSETFHHHIPDDVPAEMSVEVIESFLHSILNKTSPVYGGKGFHIRFARLFYDFKRSLEDMWQGNPILLVVLFTLPSIFFLLIMWACCCADILDADEENEDEGEFHEKRE